MKKFHEIYKLKMNESESNHENTVLVDFRAIYSAMLENYSLKSIHQLDEKTQISFLTELNHYWSEEEGINEKGRNFLMKHSISLNENSTSIQKKNYFRDKSYIIINETIRQSNIKYKIYDLLDEIYHQINGSDIADILSPEMITSIISESFNRSLIEFTSGINKELSESSQPKRKYIVKVKKS